jgi:hypothetical protein
MTSSAAMAMTGLSLLLAAEVAEAQSVALVWPPSLAVSNRDLEITDIYLTIECAEVSAIRFIPEDWNVNVTRPVSAVAKFHAEAGHGGSHLPDLSTLQGAIVLSNIDRSCFKLSGHVLGFTAEYDVAHFQFKLEPVEGPMR